MTRELCPKCPEAREKGVECVCGMPRAFDQPEPKVIRRQRTFYTQVDREDGRITALKTEGGWMLRTIAGPAWFWNFNESRWVIVTSDPDLTSPDFVQPISLVLDLLETLEQYP